MESRGYWTAILLFELWAAFAGLSFGFQSLGVAGLFIGWNVVRLYLSPFLRFALMRSLTFLAAITGVFVLRVFVSAGPEIDDKRFILTVSVLLWMPVIGVFHLWKLPHFEALIAEFEVTRD